MKYKVFISATKSDLAVQRAFVADQLRQADIDVNRMEEWPADSEHPALLSAERTKACDICIAIVGFQRGTIATHDPQQRSITQIEIDAASKNGAKVLYFLLEDTAANRNLWPTQHNHLSDPRVQEWRRDIQTNQTCQYFQAGSGVDSLPHVLPAVLRQISRWEQKRRRQLLLLISVVLLGLTSAGLAVDVSGAVQNQLLSRLLVLRDPVVFNHARDHNYKVARLIDGRSDLRDNTNFREELVATQSSFKMFANQFSSFQEYQQEFEQMLQRGARVQIIVTDYSDANRQNVDAFYKAVDQAGFAKDGLAVTRGSVVRMRAMAKKYPDQFEFRLNRMPMLYTMWIRDEDSDKGLGNLGVNNYASVTSWPYFRVSNVTGGSQLRNLKEQFEVLWKNAIRDEEL